MQAIASITVVMALVGISEVIAVKSKGYISTLFSAAFLLMIGFWIGLPKDIFISSGMLPTSMVLVGFLLTGMGSMIDLNELLQQWKTVIIAFVAVIMIVLIVGLAGSLFIDSKMALASSTIVAGGAAAQIIMAGVLKLKNLLDIEIFCLLVLSLQSFLGLPICSIILRKEAVEYISSGKYKNRGKRDSTRRGALRKKLIPQMPEKYQKPVLLLAKTGVVTLLAYYVSGLTGGKVNALLLCLVFGIISQALGFLEKDILTKANSFAIVLFYAYALIFSSLPEISPLKIFIMIVPLIIVFALGIIGIVTAASIMGKMLKVEFKMAMAIGLTALFGFPGTYYIAMEVAEAVGENEEQVKSLIEYLLPKMLTAGFTTVSIASVIIVSIMVNFI